MRLSNSIKKLFFKTKSSKNILNQIQIVDVLVRSKNRLEIVKNGKLDFFPEYYERVKIIDSESHFDKEKHLKDTSSNDFV